VPSVAASSDPLDMSALTADNLLRRRIALVALTVLYFLLMADTFNSLGVVLPSMVTDLHLDWGSAGFGFMLLGLGCGLTSPLPAVLIRRVGTAPTLVLAGIVLAAGFACFACASSAFGYDAGAVLLGLGFTLGGTVPGTHVIATVSSQPARLMGAYFTGGSLGAIAGPMLYLGIAHFFGTWRPFWWVCGAATATAAIVAAFAVSGIRPYGAAKDGPAVPGWPTRRALAAPAFWIIVAAYTGCLAINTTMHSFAVQHLTERGLSHDRAAEMMSAVAILGAVGAALAGVVGQRVGARVLTVLATLAMTGAALSFALPQTPATLACFTLTLGLGLGIVYVASAMLLLEYFGSRHNLELYSAMCLISTLAALGPWLAGRLRDSTGGFENAFAILGIIGLALSIAILLMRRPDAPGHAA